MQTAAVKITDLYVKENWPLRVADKDLVLSHEEMAEMEEHLKRWTTLFPQEGTYAESIGVPSLLVRFDYAIGQQPFEIEERPCGMGVMSLLSPQFESLFGSQVELWRRELPGEFAIWVSGARDLKMNYDDALWSDHFGVPLEREVPQVESARYYWPRTNPTDLSAASHVSPKLLAPVLHEGDKRYGEKMGWWKLVPPEPDWFPREPGSSDIAEYLGEFLPAGGAIKAKGTRMESVVLWNPELKNKASGIASHKKVLEFIRARRRLHQAVFAQPWSHPEVDEDLPGYYRFRRVYWAYDLLKGRYVCIGGCWLARPELRLHGASNAITGRVLVP